MVENESKGDCKRFWKLTRDGFFWECSVHSYVFKSVDSCKYYEAPPLPLSSSADSKSQKRSRVSYRKKKVRFGSHDGSHSGSTFADLTKVEQEVLDLIFKENLTPKQISIRRQTSIRFTQKIMKRLREKGAITNALQMVRNFTPTHEPFSNLIRLHGEEWHISIIYKDSNYKAMLEKSNFFDFDGNTIRLSRDSVEVYVGKSFFADSVDKATIKSVEYFDSLIVKLEHQLRLILKKPRVQNIKRVNAHYSEINNQLAKDYEVKGDRIKIYSREDGKLWFLIDNSFNLHEAETVHPERSKEDMGETIVPYFNDLRDKKHDLPSETKEQIGQLASLMTTLTEVNIKAETRQEHFGENLASHVKAIQDLGSGVAEMNRVLQKIDSKVTPKTLPDKEARLLRVKALRKEWGW